MESCEGSLKNEPNRDRRFATRSDAKRAITEHIEFFYNRIRKQVRSGYLIPAAFIQQHFEKHIVA
jgi:putative transposase